MKKIIIGTTILILTAIIITGGMIGYWFKANGAFLQSTSINKEIFIEKGQSYSKLYKELTDGLETPFKFDLYLRYIKKVPQHMKFGYYAGENISLNQFIDNIINGVQSTVKVTVPEGVNVFEIAKAVDKAGITTEKQFLDAVFNKELVKKITGGDYTSMEGFLFPGTYKFPKNFNEIKVIETMYADFQKNLPVDFKAKALEKGLTEYEAIIVASIVQKETYKQEESPIVASVYLNRIKIGMPLQADPTILYGNFMRGNFEIKIGRKDLRDETNIYNTYKHKGLTPTPISNPSLMALEAVTNPADTKYLFFVANKNGEHLFSETYDTHRNYVNIHQKQ